MTRLYYPKELRHAQYPKRIVVCCSDSRESETKLTGWKFKPGALFVIRNAGNCALFDDALASIYYGLEHLHANEIMIMGHSNCGMMKLLLNPDVEKNSTIKSAAEFILSAVFDGKPPTNDVDELARESVNRQVEYFIRKDELTVPLIETKKIAVLGTYFDFSSGVPRLYLINENGKRLDGWREINI